MSVVEERHLNIGFPSGILQGVLPIDALGQYRDAQVSTVEIHPQFPTDPLLEQARHGFCEPSVHLPCQPSLSEPEVLAVAHAALEWGYTRLILHPNVIRHFEPWRELGERLLIENLDFRCVGFRYVEELNAILNQLPDARCCLDLGHAVNGSLCAANDLFESWGNRIGEIHFSEIDPLDARHLSNIRPDHIEMCLPILNRVSANIPIILELAPQSLPHLQGVRRQVIQAMTSMSGQAGTPKVQSR